MVGACTLTYKVYTVYIMPYSNTSDMIRVWVDRKAHKKAQKASELLDKPILEVLTQSIGKGVDILLQEDLTR